MKGQILELLLINLPTLTARDLDETFFSFQIMKVKIGLFISYFQNFRLNFNKFYFCIMGNKLLQYNQFSIRKCSKRLAFQFQVFEVYFEGDPSIYHPSSSQPDKVNVNISIQSQDPDGPYWSQNQYITGMRLVNYRINDEPQIGRTKDINLNLINRLRDQVQPASRQQQKERNFRTNIDGIGRGKKNIEPKIEIQFINFEDKKILSRNGSYFQLDNIDREKQDKKSRKNKQKRNEQDCLKSLKRVKTRGCTAQKEKPDYYSGRFKQEKRININSEEIQSDLLDILDRQQQESKIGELYQNTRKFPPSQKQQKSKDNNNSHGYLKGSSILNGYRRQNPFRIRRQQSKAKQKLGESKSYLKQFMPSDIPYAPSCLLSTYMRHERSQKEESVGQPQSYGYGQREQIKYLSIKKEVQKSKLQQQQNKESVELELFSRQAETNNKSKQK